METQRSRRIDLSICITTRNRAHVIGRTLESILCQTTEECEIIVLDAASADNTEECVREYVRRSPLVRYFRAATNNGLDADYDRTVELASGEYCWLMSDDDLFKPWAVATVLGLLPQNFSLLVANAEAVDVRTMRVLEQSRFKFEADRVYAPHEIDQLFIDTSTAMTYIGSVIIKRAVWLARERRRYYGSYWTHLGVIFQLPLPEGAKVIIKPLIQIVQGNERSFSSRLCEIVFIRMPQLVETLALSPRAKNLWMKPWTKISMLLLLRACGLYSLQEFRRCILPNRVTLRERIVTSAVALLPIAPLRGAMIAFYSIFRPRSTDLVWLKSPRI